ncbi:sulfur carrier protein ThiS [Kordiimonas sp. SCSIO 12610]|nr:sulfur carrier protein ThiS [Kordiimonas sp. SCSIO 12610]UTW53840.1 sulfur carrier protein ThiS [Kordiimonas sp. SCSIO 12610]
MITLIINGDEKRTKAGQNLAELLESMEINPTKVAVERNREIVPKSTYHDVMIEEGDQLEIVHFIGGGLLGR